MAGGVSRAGGVRIEPKDGAQAGRRAEGGIGSGLRLVRRAVLGDAPNRSAASGRIGPCAGPDRRARTGHRASAGGPAFFSRSLAALGRQASSERRAHLYEVIQKMTSVE